MKTFEILEDRVPVPGLPVHETPFFHVRVGEGGNKRHVRVPLGGRDMDQLLVRSETEGVGPRVFDADVLALRGPDRELDGRHLLVAPRGPDPRVLVLWRVPSGYRGGASIEPGPGVRVVSKDTAWHSGRGALGETAEALAILEPGGVLTAHRSGRRVQDTCLELRWDGLNFETIRHSGEAVGDADLARAAERL